MKKNLLVFSALLIASSLTGCGDQPAEEGYEIAVCTDVGQLNDGGFNQGTYEGAKEFAEGHNLTYKYYQPANGSDATDADRVAAMEQAIENGAKVIVTPGFLQQSAIAEVAARHTDVKFVFVDGWTWGQANVTAISYKEQEAGYLAGYAAVKDGYAKLAGTFGGGGTNAACNRFAMGYVQGIAKAAAELTKKVDVTISFQYGSSFSASPELQTQVSGWYNAGTEVVFACGGSMLQSVKSACSETTNGKIIGVDVDQAGESDRVITSAAKGLRESVIKILGEIYDNSHDYWATLSDSTSNLGAADNATYLPTKATSWRFNTFTVAEYEALYARIVAGTEVISSTMPENGNMADASLWTVYGNEYTTVHYE